MNSKRYMRNQLTGVLAVICGMLALSAQWLFGAASLYNAANTYDAAVDTHMHSINRSNDAAVSARHLLWKEGSTPGTGAAVCGANALPLGTIDNIEASTGLSQKVILLGKERTVKMVANAALAIGDWVYTAASGKVQGTPTVAGTYYRVGRVLTASGTDGDVIEVESVVPQKIIVIAAATAAALTGTPTGTANGSIVDVAATAPACAGTSTPSAGQVDTAINLALSTVVSGVNEQNAELMTMLNKVIADQAALRLALATPVQLQALAA